ncbi:hypothetical protein DAEQUDRAFT_764074 [Daedalea quercina L-15889]|uniref:Uncharacterized protein n=1 Tax=Daedalea quercina L-15889 TaxID=1314783 RepID=A0A165RTK8_9APHY|nr:hypothetical protein DAEQUDRAFT_764074 [Daedalea quercina L-15889]
MSSILIEPILKWVALSPSISTLHKLTIHPTENSDAAGHAIDHFLEKVGNGLNDIDLQVFVPGYSPSLAASGLATIRLDVQIFEDTQHLEATLYALTYALSSITSQNLLKISLLLWFNAFDVGPAVPDFLQANPLASVFSRDVFSERAPAIHLGIEKHSDNWTTILDAAVAILPTLFKPWKEQGELTIRLPYGYRNKSKAIPEAGDSGVEDEDIEDLNEDHEDDGSDENDEDNPGDEEEEGSV